MLRALLFDLDGTLVDTEQQTMTSITSVMAALGHPELQLRPEEVCGRSWADIARRLRELAGLSTPQRQIEDDLLQTWNQLVSRQVTPIPGVREALAEAGQVGFLIGVVSSSPRSVIDAMLDALGCAALIPDDARIGADSVQRYKPDPEGYLLGASRLGVSPAECLVFEDSTSGLRAARAAEMLSVAVLYASHERERCADLADAVLVQYQALPAGFFSALLHAMTPKQDLARLL